MKPSKEELFEIAIPKQISLHPSYRTFKKQAMIKHPRDFEELSPAYELAISSFQTSHAHYKGKSQHILFGLHNSDFVPAAQEMMSFLKDYSRKNTDHRFTQRLVHELQNVIENQEMNLLFFLALPFRYAASISRINKSEKNIFHHFPHSNLFFTPLENESWKNNTSILLGLSFNDDKIFNSFLICH